MGGRGEWERDRGHHVCSTTRLINMASIVTDLPAAKPLHLAQSEPGRQLGCPVTDRAWRSPRALAETAGDACSRAAAAADREWQIRAGSGQRRSEPLRRSPGPGYDSRIYQGGLAWALLRSG